jgi:hypothetical protein
MRIEYALRAYLSLIIVVFFVVSTALASDSGYVATGAKAKNFKLNDQHMQLVELDKLRGSTVVIIYTGRNGFDDAAEIIKKLDKKHHQREDGNKAGKDIRIVGAANLKGVPAFVKKMVKNRMKEPRYPSFLMDWKGEIAAAYGYDEKGIAAFVVDGKGIVRFAGNIKNADDDISKVSAIIDSI